MFLQDNDPHHMHPDFNYVYYFLIIAPIVAIAVIYFGMKILDRLGSRKDRRAQGKKDGTGSTVK